MTSTVSQAVVQRLSVASALLERVRRARGGDVGIAVLAQRNSQWAGESNRERESAQPEAATRQDSLWPSK